jgi:hypothetical protein
LCCQQKKRLKIWLAGGFDSLGRHGTIFSWWWWWNYLYEKAIRYGWNFKKMRILLKFIWDASDGKLSSLLCHRVRIGVRWRN